MNQKIARRGAINIVASDFTSIRASLERIVGELGGFFNDMTVASGRDQTRSLHAVLRVPADRSAASSTRARREKTSPMRWSPSRCACRTTGTRSGG